jgi:hypothetical protein
MSEATPTPQEPSKPPRRHPGGSHLSLWIGGGLLGAVAAFFAGEAWLNGYLGSEAFRSRTEAAIGRALKADARLAPLQRQGTVLVSETIALRGGPAAVFAAAEVQGIRAEVDLSGLWQRLWRIEHLGFQRLNVDLNKLAPVSVQVAGSSAEPVEATTVPGSQVSSSPQGLLAALLPNRTQIATLHTDRASFSFTGSELRQSRLTARPSEAGAGWEAVFESGELSVPGLPAIDLQEARLALRNGGGVLRNSRLLVKKGGQASLIGEWSTAGGYDFHAKLENVAVEPFLPVWWQTRLSGLLQGGLHMQRSAGAPEILSGDLRLTGGKLEAFPLLSQLDSFVGSPRFRQVALKTASAKLKRSAGRTELTELDLDADGILRIQGTVLVQNGTLDGRMQLGIPPAIIQWLPGSRTKLFSEPRDGYVWTPFTLTGPVGQPVEDLTPRLAGAAVEAVTETLKKLPASLPPGVPEAAKGLLDAVKSLLPGR